MPNLVRFLPTGRRRSEGGSTIVELLIALSILSVGLLAHGSLTLSSMTQSELNRERRLALEGLRSQLEQMRAWDFRQCYSAFDLSSANDPPGAPGSQFDILGLEPVSPGGRVGRVLLPTAPNPSGTPPTALREDLSQPDIGLPADLDGDGAIDNLPKDDSYVRLPVRVEARWRGVSGEQQMIIATWLGGQP
ncbi:MAG: type II secretion system protein [Planctomycetota bacterium]